MAIEAQHYNQERPFGRFGMTQNARGESRARRLFKAIAYGSEDIGSDFYEPVADRPYDPEFFQKIGYVGEAQVFLHDIVHRWGKTAVPLRMNRIPTVNVINNGSQETYEATVELVSPSSDTIYRTKSRGITPTRAIDYAVKQGFGEEHPEVYRYKTTVEIQQFPGENLQGVRVLISGGEIVQWSSIVFSNDIEESEVTLITKALIDGYSSIILAAPSTKEGKKHQ